MKILRKGNNTLNMHITCAGCGSLLEAIPEDFKVTLDKVYFTTCPNCNLTMRLAETEISQPMKWAIASTSSLDLHIDMDELDKNLSFLKRR